MSKVLLVVAGCLAAILFACIAGPAGADDGRDTSRRYELVSPSAKEGNQVSIEMPVQSTPDGNSVAFAAPGAFGDAQTSVVGTYYVARRSGADWVTHGIDPRQTNNDIDVATPTVHLNADLSKAVQFSGYSLGLGGIEGGGNLYLRDLLTGASTFLAGDTSTIFASAFAPATGTRLTAVSASKDMSHVVFSYSGALLPDALAPDAPDVAGPYNIYEWHGGQLRLVNVLPDGTVAFGSGGSVSADGSKIFFNSGGSVYVRINGTTTLPLAVSRRAGDPSTPMQGTLKAASEDGNIVYFTSEAALTDDADLSGWPALYKYDFRSDSLTDVSATGVTAADPTNVGFGINGTNSVMAVSGDGEYVYFQSEGKLTDDANLYENNFYVAHDGVISLIASSAWIGPGANRMSISSSGRFVAFTSVRQLTQDEITDPGCKSDGDYVNDDGVCVETYMYDADLRTLACLACNPVDDRPRLTELAGGQSLGPRHARL
ncbi:MAG: hypothetical protein ABUM26_03490, partial [Solirubrobacterales bacterium]